MSRNEEQLLDRRWFFDPRVFERERSAVFDHTWVFVAHEDELEPGGWVTRQLGGTPVVVTRAEDGEISVLANSCTHRGTMLCREDRGRDRHMRCMYHGWTYALDGRLVAVPGLRSWYPPDFDRSAHGLFRARVESRHGLVFATWDHDLSALGDFLGPMDFYLGALFDRPTGGFRVWGPPLRWAIRTDWKLATENFAHDTLHVPTLHASGSRINFDAELRRMGDSWVVDCGHGHGVEATKAHPSLPDRYPGYPEACWDDFDANLSPDQRAFAQHNNVYKGNVFPNLSFIELVHDFIGDDAAPTAGLMLRQVQPTGPGCSVASMWMLAPAGLDEAWRERSALSLVRTLGPSGSFEPDDLENAACSPDDPMTAARLAPFVYRAGAHFEPETAEADDPQLPGRVYVSDINTEIMQRSFYREWETLTCPAEVLAEP